MNVGDRVKLIPYPWSGRVGTIDELDAMGTIWILIDGEENKKWFYPYEFALITNTSVNPCKDIELPDTPLVAKPDGGSSAYYELPKDARELGDLIEHKRMNFNVGNIFKAAYRLGDKPGVDELYDLNKIVWFANREINRIKKAA